MNIRSFAMRESEIKAFLRYFYRCKKKNPDLCILVEHRDTRRHTVKDTYVLEGLDPNKKYICYDDIFTDDEILLVEDGNIFFGYPIFKNKEGRIEVSTHLKMIHPNTVCSMDAIPKEFVKII